MIPVTKFAQEKGEIRHYTEKSLYFAEIQSSIFEITILIDDL